jgi:hypothetical protein
MLLKKYGVVADLLRHRHLCGYETSTKTGLSRRICLSAIVGFQLSLVKAIIERKFSTENTHLSIFGKRDMLKL